MLTFSAPLRLVIFNRKARKKTGIETLCSRCSLWLKNFTAKTQSPTVHTQLNVNLDFEYAQNTPSTPGYSPGEVCLLQE
jgi:hypothetical protein